MTVRKKWIEENVAADRLIALPENENARRGNVEGIARSIEELDFWGVLVVRAQDHKIIVGNHRYRAGVKQGQTHFDVQWWDVDEKTAIRMALADNRWGDLSTFDRPTLVTQLCDFDLEDFAGTGFTPDDLEDMLGGLPPLPELTPDDVEFVVGLIRFLVTPEDTAEWHARIEHEAGPNQAEQVAAVKERLGLIG